MDTTGVSGDPRPVVAPAPFLGPGWGLHIHDVNLALGNLVLGNLVRLVKVQRDAYLAGR